LFSWGFPDQKSDPALGKTMWPKKSEDRWKLAGLFTQVASPVISGGIGAAVALTVANWNRPPEPSAKLFAECGVSAQPIRVDANYEAYVLSLFPVPGENGGGGLTRMFQRNEGEIKIASSPLDAVRCKITNYGAITAVSIQMTAILMFHEAISEGLGARSGKTTLHRRWPFLISKIEPGPDRAFVFYVLNMSDQFARAEIQPAVQFQYLGEATPRQSVLTISGGIAMLAPRSTEKTLKGN
jgi:hypothetical protein